MSPKEFNDNYWFAPLQLVTVLNPRAEDYTFMVEMRTFTVPAGGTQQFPGHVANVYLDHITKEIAQEEEKFGNLSDLNLKKQYYDSMIVKVAGFDTKPQEPEYLKAPNEAPPWQNNEVSREPVKAKQELVEPKKEVKEPTTKEFELQGDKYKMIVNKLGNTMFYKNGALTNEAEYTKAASLL